MNGQAIATYEDGYIRLWTNDGNGSMSVKLTRGQAAQLLSELKKTVTEFDIDMSKTEAENRALWGDR